jgi:hypothetical protein
MAFSIPEIGMKANGGDFTACSETACHQVYPSSVEEIQAVLKMASRQNSTVYWKAGGSSAGFKKPFADSVMVVSTGGMKRIVEVNEAARYAVVEPGVTQEELSSHLEEYHPGLMHCLKASLPGESITDTALGDGKNTLSALYGGAAGMIQGLEVVLPDSTVCKIGSCSASPLWFAGGPLPDLRGLFLNRNGVPGIITKLSLRLFPVPRHKDMAIYTLKNPGMLPEVIERATHPELADQVGITGKELPSYMKGVMVVSLHLSGATQKEILLKKEVFKNLFHSKEIIYKDNLTSEMRAAISPAPQPSLSFFTSLEKISAVWARGAEIIHSKGGRYLFDFSVLDHGRQVLGTMAFVPPDNGKDTLLKPLKNAVVESGGVFFDAYQEMEIAASDLLKRVIHIIDPKCVMSPNHTDHCPGREI